MQLTQAQKQIVLDSHRFRVVCCGRRFGKTTMAIEEIIACAVSKKERQIAYIAPTYQQARDIAWEMLKNRCRPIASNINESRLEIELKTQDDGISKIYLRGWESIEGLRGQRFDFLVIDEVAMMRNFWLNWHEVLRPTLTDTRGQTLFISTPKGFNHFYDLYTTKDEDYTSFHFTTYDNPFIPKDEIDKAKEEIPEDRFSQEYLADFRKTEGLVYKEFKRDLHIVKTIPEQFAQVIAGLDFGYTNPYALLVIGVDKDNHYWVTNEKYETGKTTAEIIGNIKNFPQISRVYPDPAEPDRIEEIKRAGINCMEVNKDIVAGIDHVRELFKNNRIHIHERCVNLIGELETYSYEDGKPDKNAPEKPIKEADHCVDSLRYSLYAHQPITTIKKRKKYNTPMTKWGG
jgi:PBSX family phage terminase large subunit